MLPDPTELNAIAFNPGRQPLIAMMDDWLSSGRAPTDTAIRGALEDLREDPGIAFFTREVFVQRFGFALPLPSTIAEIAAMGPVLEVAAGSGYLSRLLEHAGAEVLATDGGDPGDFGLTAGSHYPVMTGIDAAAAIAQAPDFTVLLSWPDDSPWVEQALSALAPGQRFVLIGEDRGGCCAGPEVFDRLARDFVRERTLGHMVFPGLHDAVEVWRRID
jgi:hypothetical protein